MTGEAPSVETLKPIDELSFEAALKELEAIVDRLDQGDVDLEASIVAYERGTALRRHCERKLEEARLRVEQITQPGPGTVPFLETGPADDGADDGGA